MQIAYFMHSMKAIARAYMCAQKRIGNCQSVCVHAKVHTQSQVSSTYKVCLVGMSYDQLKWILSPVNCLLCQNRKWTGWVMHPQYSRLSNLSLHTGYNARLAMQHAIFLSSYVIIVISLFKRRLFFSFIRFVTNEFLIRFISEGTQTKYRFNLQ